MWFSLPRLEDTRAFMEDSIERLAEGPVIPNLNRSNGRPCVIRNNDGIVLWSKNEVAGVCSMGADGVELFQRPGARVGNAVGGHRARGLPIEVVGLIDCIEELAVWVQGKEGRAWCFSGQPET